MCSLTNVCFMCTNDNDCSVIDDKIVTQVQYVLPEITILNLDIPLHICVICIEKLKLFNEFKHVCLINTRQYKSSIKVKQTTNRIVIQSNDQIEVIEIHNNYPDSNNENNNIKSDYCSDENDIEPTNDIHDLMEVCVQEQDGSIANLSTEENTDPKSYYCTVCNTSFTSKPNLEIHIKQHMTDKQATCAICNQVLSNKKALKTHMLIHADVRKYQCSLCEKKFMRNQHLKRHMLSHTDKKDFNCEVCSVRCKRKDALILHMRTHDNVQDYHCEICNKVFVKKSTMTEHRMTHIIEYECKPCNMVFLLKDHLTKHNNTVHLVKTYTCAVCNKSFKNKGSLISHVQTHSETKE